MFGSHNSIFDSPSFLQKVMKKKSTKQNLRPLYTAEIVSEDGPWKKQINAATKVASSYTFNTQRRTKAYNQPSAVPSLSPSVSSTTTCSYVSDSNIRFTTPSCSNSVRKRPLSSEILIRIMDQRLLKKKQLESKKQDYNTLKIPELNRSTSTNTSPGNTSPRLDKLLLQTSSSATTTTSTTKTTGGGNITATIRKKSLTQSAKKMKPSKSVLNKLNYTHHTQELITDWPYVLTQDNDEQDRMVAQHYLLRTAFGSDFSSPIKGALQKGIVVLDVGCGPGTWTMEMSTAFPKSTFIGIDQSEFYPRDIKPRNCHFRTCGSLVQHQLPLPFPDNSIDYIYQRDMNWGLTGQTWQPLLQEYRRILKPGGWIEFVEPDLETQNSFESECVMNDKLMSGLTMRQQDPYLVHRLPTMLSINGFKSVEDYAQTFPLGWGSSYSSFIEGDEEAQDKDTATTQLNCSEFARAMSSQYLFLLKSLKPWLSTVMNISYKKYDDYISGLPTEWTSAQTYVNWHCITAQKPFHS
ncbi:S-adenosyl-L-methionine-dependent methyltransferase [Helicostylum pulchrum]|uniref:Methyltransferase domain-containing protein n=1 Tax=Helicostylum pulchrum TaxID=562976 RepID=A0ABP9YGP3_9FUNG|nr:S-adenosyl-L-methionine-dependent methyltransferase [Helicostylum pulchrum]